MSITFVAPEIYSLLSNNSSNYGGAEVQQYNIAKELKAHNEVVKIITYGDSYNQYINKDNLFIITIARNPSKFRVINLFLKSYNFWYALKLCNSHIYYNRVPSFITFITALFSKLYNKKFIFATANERHCNNDICQILGKSKLFLYKISLKIAYKVVAQTMRQKYLLKKHFNINSVIIPNLVSDKLRNNKIYQNKKVLWIGSLSEKKRPHMLIELAENNNNIEFLVAGGINQKNPKYSTSIINKMNTMSNVEYLGPIPFNSISNVYKQGKILLNTSIYEGFPNVFLEAWINKIPVISFFDPDGIISNNRLGKVVYDMIDLQKTIIEFINNSDLINEYGEKGKKYVEDNHLNKTIIPKYKLIFN